MKKNSLHLIQFSTIPKLRDVLLLAAIFIATLTSKAQTPVKANLQLPTIVSGCAENEYILKYISNSSHALKIKAQLVNADTNCNSNAYKPQVFFKIVASNYVNTFVFDTATQSFTCNVTSSGSDSVYIQYKIFIDCSILQLDSSIASSVSLQQTFTEVSNTLTFSINNDTNVQTSSIINSPRLLLEQATNLFSINYLQSSSLQFVYKNYSSVTANIGFKFFLEDTTFCSHGQTTGLFYSTDSISFSPVNLTGSTMVTINPYGKLFIRQYAMETNCIDTLCTTNKAHLQWHCNFDATYNQLFCDNCLQEQVFPFNVRSDDHAVVKIIDNYPDNFFADTSCFNDVLNMKTWQYTIVHDSISLGAADTLYTYILNSLQPAGKNMITLIPYSSIHFEVKSQHAIFIDTATTFYTNYLCKNFISDAILNFKINIAHFQKGDTLILSFKTFNCAEENDSVLLGKGKQLNFWAVSCKALDICGNKIETEKPLNIEYTTGLASIQQELEFFPTVTHLNVPVNATFGDSVHLSVVLKRLQSIQYLEPSYQYLGCPYTTLPYMPCNNPQGILRVRFKFGLGLHIDQPLQRVFMQLDTGGTPINVFADYYNTAITAGECDSGYYYFYFHFSDTLLFMLNNSGSLKSTVTACCSAEPVTKMQIAFHFAPNPNGCFNVAYPTNFIDPPTFDKPIAFIPLSAVGQNFEIHCPGCKAPGIIVDRYVLKRVSYGLQDSNNNHFADDSLILITDTSTWYADHKNKLRENFSSYGDVLRDFTISHFQDGSNIPSTTDPIIGYTYNEMLAHSAVLKYLQTSINIADTNSNNSWLTPLDYDFYIDEHTTIKNSCVDCEMFEADTNFTTLVHLHIPESLLTSFIQIVAGEGIYNYTFSTDSSSPFYIFSNPTLIQYQNAAYPFTAFVPDQRYRLTVHYNECLQFSNVSIQPTLDDVRRDVDIDVAQWLSGLPQPLADSGSTTPPMPNDTIRLHFEHWTIDTAGYPTLDSINQLFANSYIFYCEYCGSPHYFFSQEANYSNSFTKDNMSNCEILMQTITSSSTAANIFDPYPYEYRPPSYYPQQYRFKFPAGYSATKAFNYIYEYQIGGFHVSNFDTIMLPPADSSGFITLPYDSLTHPICLTDSDAPSGIIPNGLPYIRDGLFLNYLNVYLHPDSCNAKTYFNNMDMADAIISNIQLPCMSYGTCNDTAKQIPIEWEYAFSQKANLFTIINSLVQPIHTHHICPTITITNEEITIDSVYNGTGYTKIKTNPAPNVFMVTPNVNYLSNFSFTPTGGGATVTANANGILQLAASLAPGATLTGTLCFDYAACQDSISVDFITGYNCNGFPDSPFVASNACFTQTNSLLITDATTQFGTDGKTEPVMFPRCKPFYKKINFYAANNGEAYPDSVSFIYPPVGFEIISAAIFNGTNPTDTVVLDTTSTALHWIITTANLDSIGIASHNLNNNQLSILFLMQANCDALDNFTSTHYIELHGHDFCNSYFVKQSPTTGNNFHYNGISNCNNCFTLSKTVDKNPVNALDTVTYTIIVCANNGAAQSVILKDIIPASNFVVISNPLDSVFSTNIVAQGCDTFLITGYFQYADNCPNTTDTARLVTFAYAVDTLETTLCNTVNEPCYSPSYTFIADSTFASNYLPSYTYDTLIIEGRFYVDTNFTLNHCLVYAYPSANIIVTNANTTLTLDSTSIIGCSQMWRGIYLEDDQTTIKATRVVISDAENGIWARTNNFVFLEGCQINNCLTGVKLLIPNPANLNHTDSVTAGYIKGTSIGKTGYYKPFFANQNDTDTLHTTGIEMQNKFFNIGDNSNMNYLHDLYYGIKTENSISTIRNTKFENIKPLTVETNATSTAIKALGHVNQAMSKVTLLPLVTALPTIINCRMGVHARYTDIRVTGTTMTGVRTGIAVNYNKHLKTAQIYNNTISASARGISFLKNEGGAYCDVQNNYIYMSGKKTGRAISVEETNAMATSNYYIEYNHILTINAAEGIYVSQARQPNILHNTVRIIHTGDSVSNGISLINCMYATSSCNQITGSNSADTNQVGMSTKTSTATTMVCNSVDSIGWGVYFEGANFATNLSTSSMTNNNEGLRLNSTAYIGQQLHKGNQFVGPFGSSYGAVDNGNALLSPLYVDTNDGSFLLPATPTSNWFNPVPGTTFFCNQNMYCNIQTIAISIDSLMERIVADSIVSTDFIEESIEIAKDKLFSYLSEDSVQYYNDTVLTNFMLANIDEALGDIYIAEKYMAACVNINDTTKREIVAIDTIATYYLDQLNAYDSIAEYERRSQYIDSLNLMVARRNFITDSLAFYNSAYLDAAKDAIDDIELESTPRDNKIHVMELLLRMMYGNNTFDEIEGEFIDVANQCPSSGGPAVFIARAALEEKYDTLYYDDRGNCAALGYYRQQIKINEKLNVNDIVVIPNPTRSQTKVVLIDNNDLIENVELINHLGLHISSKGKINSKFYNIDVSNLSNGIYVVKVKTVNNQIHNSKLIVLK